MQDDVGRSGTSLGMAAKWSRWMAGAGVVALAAAGCGSDAPTGPTGEAEGSPPFIAPIPSTADHDIDFDHVVRVNDPDGDSVVLGVTGLPAWLSWDGAEGRLYGIPGEERLNQVSTVEVTAWDGTRTTTRRVRLQVVVGTSRFSGDAPWARQTPHAFKHDGEPVESEHFLVYGGHSAPEERAGLSAFLEEALVGLTERLGADPEQYEFPPGGRLHVFGDKLQGDGFYGYSGTVNGWAFRDGFLVMAWDAPRRTRQGYSRARWEALVTHELMHDVEFLLIGRDARLHATDAWFREGIATYMAGRAAGGTDVFGVTASAAQQWRATHPNDGNPIAVHSFNDFPPGADTGSYYLWFAQAIRYMVADEGFGLGEAGLRGIYEDVRAGLDFATSFENRTGVSLADFEHEFWERLDAFLP